MTIDHVGARGLLAWLAIAFGLYSILKFAFFFVLGYRTRRTMLDRAYGSQTSATGTSDRLLLAAACLFGAAFLIWGTEPIGFLGGLLVGASLIQLFFHRFHNRPSADRAAPLPTSPLKEVSYAIQDQPSRAWREMAALSLMIVASIARYFGR